MKKENFYKTLVDRVNVYSKRYPNSYPVSVLKLIWFMFKSLFHNYRQKQENQEIAKFYIDEKLTVAVRLDGDFGDIIVYSMWVKEFFKYMDFDIAIDVYAHQNEEIGTCIFKKNTFIHEVYPKDAFEVKHQNYDVSIGFRRHPYIYSINNHERIKKEYTKLDILINEYQKFKTDNEKFFNYGPILDTSIDLYSIIRNEKRIQAPDIKGLLKINNQTNFFLSLNENNLKFLEEYKLDEFPYITLTRSVATTSNQENNVRLWPLEYYESLINKTKKEFPSLRIIQLGINTNAKIKNCDIDLRGKTSLEDIKVILKYSLLHIDGECGMVHAKRALNGCSAVLFAQTSPSYLGYPENINLKSNACPNWCEWISNQWQNKCIREDIDGGGIPICMRELKPEFVFSEIKSKINEKINEFNLLFKNIKQEKFTFHINEDLLNKISNQTGKRIIFYGKKYMNYAIKLAKSNNHIILYDEQIEKSEYSTLQQTGILFDFANIYNIPEKNNSCHYVFADISNKNQKFALKELYRILKN